MQCGPDRWSILTTSGQVLGLWNILALKLCQAVKLKFFCNAPRGTHFNRGVTILNHDAIVESATASPSFLPFTLETLSITVAALGSLTKWLHTSIATLVTSAVQLTAVSAVLCVCE